MTLQPLPPSEAMAVIEACAHQTDSIEELAYDLIGCIAQLTDSYDWERSFSPDQRALLAAFARGAKEAAIALRNHSYA